MGQDIHVVCTATSATKSISLHQDSRAHRAIYDSGAGYKEAFESLVEAISRLFPDETFEYEGYSSRDFEDDHFAWASIKGGTYQQSFYETVEEGEDETVPSPDWFTSHVVEGESTWLTLVDCRLDNVNDIELVGFTADEVLAVARLVGEEMENARYVRFSDTEMIVNGEVTPISTLTEKQQLECFGIKPAVVNITYTLFSWNAEKKVFDLHPELKGMYGSYRDALAGYRKGEYALWQTSEGLKFYAVWRDRYDNSDKTRYRNYQTLCNVISPIEGENMKSNVLFDRAVSEFVEDSIEYKDGSFKRRLCEVNKNNRTVWKMIQTEDGLEKIYFNIAEFYPLGVEFYQVVVEILDSRAYGKPGNRYEVSLVEASEWYTYRYTAVHNGVVVYEETV
jgi:hypothetical protein